uniref:Uncharacterized protein n=1 Tax=Oryza brachyantha TaxID=4533 RepID=J3NCU9_ORYBR
MEKERRALLRTRSRNVGLEWLLVYLHELSETQFTLTLMLLWRIWFIRNELKHGKEACPIVSSCRFLSVYVDSLLLIKQFPNVSVQDGKQIINYYPEKYTEKCKKDLVQSGPKWIKPNQGWMKLNIDGSFAE